MIWHAAGRPLRGSVFNLSGDRHYCDPLFPAGLTVNDDDAIVIDIVGTFVYIGAHKTIYLPL